MPTAPVATTASWDAVMWSPQVIASLITLIGVIAVVFARDYIINLRTLRTKREEELRDRGTVRAEQRLDLLKIYAVPLHDAAESLYYRLDEIVIKKQARYLRADVPKTAFLEYKKISTLYRVAALLGWIRAIKRERGYLDPKPIETEADKQIISGIEASLADGAHVELQRLDELLHLWRVSDLDKSVKAKISYKIDGSRAEYLAANKVLSATDLTEQQQRELSEICAEEIRKGAGVEIPKDLVTACSRQSAVIFNIKEAYIYRDWQAAIGDFMLVEIEGGVRRFSIMGYGEFEDHYIRAYETQNALRRRRWFNRLEAIVYDINMEQSGIFDARRDQLKKLYESCSNLKNFLRLHTQELERQAIPESVQSLTVSNDPAEISPPTDGRSP